ncbi:MAG: response regulator [Bdellovibrionales bacterium]|nr:response regulator [Bdellovibrionales bacterium]
MEQMKVKSRPLIILVDDEPMLLDTFSTVLGDDYDTRSFNSPDAFLSYIDDPAAIQPDLLISDLMMPGLTGTEMISRAIEKGMAFPSILLSGNLDKETVIQAVNLGVFKVFEKPIRTDVLMGAIDQLLIEHEVARSRVEVRELTAQLREVYKNFRLIAEPHLPAEVANDLKNLVSGSDLGRGNNSAEAFTQGRCFDELMDDLETRLNLLLDRETVLQEMRHSRARASV